MIQLKGFLVPVTGDSPSLFGEENGVVLIPDRFVQGVNYPLNAQRPITQIFKVEGVAESGGHSNAISFHVSEVNLEQASFSYRFLRSSVI